jgi:hypothetical protein
MHEFEPQKLDNLTVHIQPLGGIVSTNPVPSQSGNTFSIIAIVLGGISFLFLPIILGPIGIVMSVVGKNKKEKLSTVALIVAIVGTVVGMIIGAVVGAATL